MNAKEAAENSSKARARGCRWGLERFAQIGLLVLGASVVIDLLTLVDPRGREARSRTEALNNLRQIGLGLSEFDGEYGRFPDATTIPKVKATTGTPLTLDDTSSNKLFRQLIAFGLKSEKPFWCRTKATPKKPDDLYKSDDKALRPGECSFAYIPGLSPRADAATPVVTAPLIRGTARFDPKPFDGRAVVLFVDNSARTLPLDESGRAILNGMDIFDPRQPFWKGKAPDIKWPESK